MNKDFVLTCDNFISLASVLGYLKEHEEHVYDVISSFFPDSYEKIEALYNAMCHDDCISVKMELYLMNTVDSSARLRLNFIFLHFSLFIETLSEAT